MTSETKRPSWMDSHEALLESSKRQAHAFGVMAGALYRIAQRVEQPAKAAQLALDHVGLHVLTQIATGEIQRERVAEDKLRAIVTWLETNKPEVFREGLWDALAEPRDTEDLPTETELVGEPPQVEGESQQSILEALVEWGERYPISRIYSATAMGTIADQLDTIINRARHHTRGGRDE